MRSILPVVLLLALAAVLVLAGCPAKPRAEAPPEGAPPIPVTAGNEAAPAPDAAATDNAAPAADEAAPAADEAAPATDEAAPATDEAAPATDEAAPKGE